MPLGLRTITLKNARDGQTQGREQQIGKETLAFGSGCAASDIRGPGTVSIIAPYVAARRAVGDKANLPANGHRSDAPKVGDRLHPPAGGNIVAKGRRWCPGFVRFAQKSP